MRSGSCCLRDRANGVGIADAYRSDQVSTVTHPVRASHLTVSVQGVYTRPDRAGLGFTTAWQDSGDACSYRAAPGHQRTVALDAGTYTNKHTRHIGDRVDLRLDAALQHPVDKNR